MIPLAVMTLCPNSITVEFSPNASLASSRQTLRRACISHVCSRMHRMVSSFMRLELLGFFFSFFRPFFWRNTFFGECNRMHFLQFGRASFSYALVTTRCDKMRLRICHANNACGAEKKIRKKLNPFFAKPSTATTDVAHRQL